MQTIAEFIPWWPVQTALILASITAALLTAIVAFEPEAARSLKEILFHRNRQIVQSYVRTLGVILDRTRFVLFPYKSEPNRRRNWIQFYGIFCSVAIFYTVVFYFISWAAGGGEVIGAQSLISYQYGILERILIAISFVIILLFGLRSVVNPETFELQIIKRIHFVKGRRQLKILLAGVAWVTMIYVFYTSTDRNIFSAVHGQPIENVKVFVAFVMSTGAAAIIFLDKLPLVPFSIIITAAFCQYFGVPIAIVIPAAVAIATLEVGLSPLLASLVVVPVSMAAYYGYGTPESDGSVLYLASLALFPVYFSVVLTRRRYFRTMLAAMISLVMFVPAFVPVVFTTSQINDLLGYSIIVLWIAIPIINAFWDALSWFVSWSLLQHLRTSLDFRLEIPDSEDQQGRKRKPINILKPSFFVVTAVAHVVFDFALAMFFLVCVFASSMAAIMIANGFAEALRPQYVVDTEALVADFIQNPMSGDGFWVTMIVASTLVPTIMHFLFACGSLITAATSPRALRNALNVLKEELPHQEKNARDQALFRITVYSGTFFFALLFLVFGAFFVFDTLMGWQTPLALFVEIEHIVGDFLGS